MNRPYRICLIMNGSSNWIGGIEYTTNIINALMMLPEDVRSTFEICLLVNYLIDKKFLHSLEPHIKQLYFMEQDTPPLSISNRIKWKLCRIFLGKYNYRLNTFFKDNNIDFAYPHCGRTTKNNSFNSAEWIPDFQHKYLPQYFKNEEIRDRDQLFLYLANYASYVVLSSETSKKDFNKFFPEAAHKSMVLSFKTLSKPEWYREDPIAVQQKYCLPDKFLLVSNQFWQHKNHQLIFEALKYLKTKSICPVIVCTGHTYDYRCPDYFDNILQSIHKFGLAQQVYILGLIPKNDQIQLMRRSIAVIQPSLFEGWSTVVEDARCMGKVIILSDIPVHIEQNPPHSHFFKQDSLESLADAIADVWSKFSSGPDVDREGKARENNIKEVLAFAGKFLELAKGTQTR